MIVDIWRNPFILFAGRVCHWSSVGKFFCWPWSMIAYLTKQVQRSNRKGLFFKYFQVKRSQPILLWTSLISIQRSVGLFKCIVKKKQSKISHFSFCNPTTSVFVIFCESVSLIQQLWKKSITCDQKAWVGWRYNGIFDSSEVVDMVKILLLTKYD